MLDILDEFAERFFKADRDWFGVLENRASLKHHRVLMHLKEVLRIEHLLRSLFKVKHRIDRSEDWDADRFTFELLVTVIFETERVGR